MKQLFARAALAGVAFLAAMSVQAVPMSLADCRAIADASPRLACYDALPLPEASATAPASPASSSAKEPAGGWFGLSRADPEKEIASTVPGHVDGWQRGTVFKLANGQVWQVMDDDRVVWDADNPKVTITPATFHGYFLNFEGLNNAPHVRRLQ